jgi:hypothetical protein
MMRDGFEARDSIGNFFRNQWKAHAMIEQSPRVRLGMIVAIVAGLATLLLYVGFLALTLADPEGGESRMANAFASLAWLAALWAMLLLLLVVDRVSASVKSWTTPLAFVLVPIAAIASLFATDYPNNRWCQLTLAALPLIVGIYLVLGRLPSLRRTAQIGKPVLLLLVAALSIYPIEKFVS